MTNLLTTPPGEPLVAASILAADFAEMGSECEAAIEAGADLLHLDVMDGHFVPNLTLGPAFCRSLRRRFPDIVLDVHLMVNDPAAYIEPFAQAGASHLTFHIEVSDDPADTASQIHGHGMTAGLAINPPTELDAILPHLEPFDMILVMSVNPGFSGQAFIPNVLDKTRGIAPRLRPDQRLEMDGGINGETAERCRDAGADVLVAASAIFGSDDYERSISQLRGGGCTAGLKSGAAS